jgi:hypothetical protein
MDYPQLTEIQLDALQTAVGCEALVQIQPDKEKDKPEVFAVWSARVEQVEALVTMGFLTEEKTEDNETLQLLLKKDLPGRTAKLFTPTKIAKDMFSGSPSKTIN